MSDGVNRVEIFKGKGAIQPWRFRAIAGNGQVVSQSEGYFSKWNAKRAARKVFPGAEIVELKRPDRG